jgi:hypothetical protein
MRSTICKRSVHRRASLIDYLLMKRIAPAFSEVRGKPHSELAGVGCLDSDCFCRFLMWCLSAQYYSLSLGPRSTSIGVLKNCCFLLLTELELIGIYHWWTHIVRIFTLLGIIGALHILSNGYTYSQNICGDVWYVHEVLLLFWRRGHSFRRVEVTLSQYRRWILTDK